MINAHDCETIPDESQINSLPVPKVKMLVKDTADTYNAKVADVRKEQIEKMSTSPLTGRLCSYSVHGQDWNEFKVIDEISDAAEIELLHWIFEHIKEDVPDGTINKMVTWNGYEFDLRFIYLRASLLKVKLPHDVPPMEYWRRKYSHDPHCDLKCEIFHWHTEHDTNLDLTARRFLGRGKTTRDYSTYVDLIKTGQGNLIGLDNLCDTELTYDLYKEVSPYLF